MVPYYRRRGYRRYRRYRPRRRYRRYRRKTGGGGSWWNTAQKALKIAMGVRSMFNTEFKLIENSAAATSVGTGGSLACVNLVAQGVTSETRSGDSIRMKNVLFRGQVKKHASGTDQRVRLIVFISDDVNGSLPAIGSVLDTTGAQPTVFAGRNLIRVKQHKVLHDQTFVLSTDRPSADFNIYKKLDAHTRYSDGGATIASLYNGSLCFVFVSDDNTNMPTYTYLSRVRFVDN